MSSTFNCPFLLSAEHSKTVVTSGIAVNRWTPGGGALSYTFAPPMSEYQDVDRLALRRGGATRRRLLRKEGGWGN